MQTNREETESQRPDNSKLYFPQAFRQAVGNCRRPTGVSAAALTLWDRFAALQGAQPTADQARHSALRDLVTSSETLVAFHRTLSEGLNAKVHHGPAPRTGIAGRGLFASKDIQVGEVILTETAAAIVPTDGSDLATRAAANVGGLDELHAALSSYYPDLVGNATDLVPCLQSVLFKCATFSTLKGYASAWFPVAGLINHDCLPNAEWSTIGDYIIIRAVRQIRNGEHVTISYLPQLTSGRSAPWFRNHRQQAIWEECRFACECELCIAQPADAIVELDAAKERALQALEAGIGEATDSNAVMEQCEASIHGWTNWTTWIVLARWFQAYSTVRLDELNIDRLYRLQQVLGLYYRHKRPPHCEFGHMCIVAAVERLHVLWMLAQRLPDEAVPQLYAAYFEPAAADLFELAAAQGPTDLMALLLMR